MGLRINTNVTALKSQRNLSASNEGQADALEKLSSGNRINKAGDDAAGLAISEKLKAHSRGLMQAKRNAADGISLVQTAEGGLNEVSNILTRVRELSVQAASDTVGGEEREYINFEFQALTDEIDRIAQVTEFNGAKLLNGESTDLEVQVGIHNNAEQDRLLYSPQSSDITTGRLGLSGLNTQTKEAAQTNLEQIDNAISQVNENRAGLGALQNRLQSTIRNLAITHENLSEANSRIRDADFAVQTSQLSRQSILQQAGTATLAQANQRQVSVLSLL